MGQTAGYACKYHHPFDHESITNADTTPVTEEGKETELPTVIVTETILEAEFTEPPKPQIPPRPVMPPKVSAFPKLHKVKSSLDKHNQLIFEAEHERALLEIARDDLKGLARLTKIKGA